MLRSISARIPLLDHVLTPLRRRRARARFVARYASFFGVYISQAHAEADAPAGKAVGYSSPALVPEYRALLDAQLARPGLESYEYPVLHWLDALWQAGEARRVVDFGGNLGTHFHAYSKYLVYPPDLAWWIVDVPPIVAAGELLAAERGAVGLRFAARAADVPAPDLLIASGSLQYLVDPFQVIRDTGAPRHLLVNRLPLSDVPTFWTLQNGGAVVYAQRIQQRDEFLAGVASLGYRVVDEWEDRVDRCDIPLHPECSVDHYCGFYLRRD